jgi:perosamine synthetase
MISRVRPYFNENYFNAISHFNPDIPRREYCIELTRQLHNYYPKAQKFEFFNYGRNALGAGLDLLDIHENDEIILPCFTCSTVLEPILKRRVIPNLVDINFDFSLKIKQIENKITKKTKAIIATHLFGIPVNMVEIKEIAETHGLYLIEDCAHAFCQKTSSRLGSTGDIAFTSHGNEKPLSIGNGGVLIINNSENAGNIDTITSKIPNESLYTEKCSFLSLACFDYATDPVRYNDFIGTYGFYSYLLDNPDKFQPNIDDIINHQKLDIIYESFKDDIQKRNHFKPIQKIYNLLKKNKKSSTYERQHEPKLMSTFLLHLFLKILPEINRVNESRINKGCLYIEKLSENSDLIGPQDKQAPYLRYSILCKKPALTYGLLNKLRSEKFEVGNYNWPQTLSKILKIKEPFETSEYISNNIINLPCYPSLHDDEINKITQIINNFTH